LGGRSDQILLQIQASFQMVGSFFGCSSRSLERLKKAHEKTKFVAVSGFIGAKKGILVALREKL
jgi:hypothetical protein